MAGAPLSAVLHHLSGAASPHALGDATDAELLERFVARREEAAFAALLRRHGPMVLAAGRRAGGRAEDAEDVFQATFLILARRAAAIRKRASLGSWLYGVAHRLALRARTRDTRRKAYERKAGSMRTPPPAPTAACRDLVDALHDALDEIPEKYRTALVLCYLEGQTHEVIARHLGRPLGTVGSWVARGRTLLRTRLARKGFALPAAALGTLLVGQTAPAAVPAALARATLRAVIPFPGGEAAAGLVSADVAALVERGLQGMFLTKVRVATWTLLTAGLLSVAAGGLLWRQAAAAEPAGKTGAPGGGGADGGAAGQPPPGAPGEKPASFAVSGHVLTPDGKSAPGARLYLWGGGLKADGGRRERAQAGDDGTFRFEAARSELLDPTQPSPWDGVQLVAAAPGFGPAWVPLGKPDDSGRRTLRLARDDVPVRGRILDLEGRPLAGVRLDVHSLLATAGEDLGPFVAAATAGKPYVESTFLTRFLPRSVTGLPPSVTTDADGRFRLVGAGRERVVLLWLRGDTISTQPILVMTRPGTALRCKRTLGMTALVYPATFEHFAVPPKPILGTVRDGEGRAVAGVTVEGPVGRATTDREGRYRLLGVPKAPQGPAAQLRVVPGPDQPYLPAVKPIGDSPGLEPLTIDFELGKGLWVSGRVTDRATGKPVPGVQVRYNPFLDNPYLKRIRGAPLPEGRTAVDGSYRVLGLPGRGVVVATTANERYLAASQRDGASESVHYLTSPSTAGKMCNAAVRIDAAAGSASVTCDLTLEPGRSAEGTVLGPDCKPVAGALVIGLKPSWRYWEPLDSASFRVTALAPKEARTLMFYHRGRKLAGSAVAREDDKGPLTVRLQPGGTVLGRLVDGDGSPYGQARLMVRWPNREKVDDAIGLPTDALPRRSPRIVPAAFGWKGSCPG
jgi:RNA polymerase sigma factor (sigma-70 family)